jgi:hypothetical protein
MPEVANLLTHFQGKSAGFTTKPFTNYPHKLVAAIFQRLGERSPLQDWHTLTAAQYTSWQARSHSVTYSPLLRRKLLVTTNKLEETSYTTKIVPTLILKDVRMSWVAALRFSPYGGQTRAPNKAQCSNSLFVYVAEKHHFNQ